MASDNKNAGDAASDGVGLRDRLRAAVAALGRSDALVVAAAVVVALVVAPVAWQFGAGTTATVAVVPIAGSIDGENAADVAERLAAARNDPSVEGVVLVVDSPGGVASPSEELYLQVARTAEQMPVVATVGTAATSGAYYAVAPADEIYVKPSSSVGSVGVYLMTPEQVDPLEEIIQSGPDKLSGESERGWEYTADTIQNAFVSSVFEHRGDELELERAELERASVYTGVDAVDLGLADELAGTQAAVQAVADRAGVDDYAIDRLQYETPVTFVSQAAYAGADVPEKELVSTTYYADPTVARSTPVVLMFPPGALDAPRAGEAPRADETEGTDDD